MILITTDGPENWQCSCGRWLFGANKPLSPEEVRVVLLGAWEDHLNRQ